MANEPSSEDTFQVENGESDADASASSDSRGVQLVSLIQHPDGFRFQDLLRAMPSWLISIMAHAAVLLALALVTVRAGSVEEFRQLIASAGQIDQLDVLEDFDDSLLEEIDLSTADVIDFDSPVMESTDVDFSDFDEPAAAISVDLNDFGLEQAPRSDLLAVVGNFTGDAMSGRGEERRNLVAAGGGNDASERAVALALEWLAKHQLSDGGWSFNHCLAPDCDGKCRNRGQLAKARNGATAIALLPFLGAGQTHIEGEYQEQVKAGLEYLVQNMGESPRRGSFHEKGGTMYSHGLAAIALCEAWGMTHDEMLEGPAQSSIDFICWAQDPVYGGWRYVPRIGCDTSVVGWQIMALKSGHMSDLSVPPATVQNANKFLNLVQANGGANYGYSDPGMAQGTTAIGLLCRMHLGWKKDNPALQRGVKWLSNQGPSKTNTYYNYYATQVLRHYDGELWRKWNSVMRDRLIRTQATVGHERGSWPIPEPGLATFQGGRLYETTMSTMILEVYYRHMPLYGKQSTEVDFPLD